MNEQRVLQITHELREHGYNSGDGEPLERQTALDAADLIEALQREQEERENPQSLTMLDILLLEWRNEPQILVGMLIKRHCTYDGCESFEMPFKLGYERTRAEAIKRTLKYLASSTEPKGEAT